MVILGNFKGVGFIQLQLPELINVWKWNLQVKALTEASLTDFYITYGVNHFMWMCVENI